jgi:hypothetical protein
MKKVEGLAFTACPFFDPFFVCGQTPSSIPIPNVLCGWLVQASLGRPSGVRNPRRFLTIYTDRRIHV